MAKVIKLSEMKKSEKGLVLTFDHNPEIRNRLNNMGLVEGSLVQVLTGSESSNYLISIGNTRIGIEPHLASAITIQRL